MDLFRSALSLAIHKSGDVTDADVDDLISRYKKRRSIDVDKASYLVALDQALKHYHAQRLCMFVCNEATCAEKRFVGGAGPSFLELQQLLPCDVEETGCHWKCESAPVLTLKVGDDQVVFANCDSDDTLRSVIEQASAVCATSFNKQSGR